MSIEQQLADNTAALRSLEAAIRAIVMVSPAETPLTQVGELSEKLGSVGGPAEPTAEPVKAAKEAKAKKPAATPAAEPVAAQQESAEPTSQSAESEAEAPAEEIKALDYEADIKPLVLQVVKSGKRDGVVALLQEFGVANASALPADQWAAFHNKLQALAEN